MEPTGLVLISI